MVLRLPEDLILLSYLLGLQIPNYQDEEGQRLNLDIVFLTFQHILDFQFQHVDLSLIHI